ncbi:transmembrane protein 87A [Brevipalpus obovatus]|uniref:transmembrane protein 87A n=1 Tax=Brevipalpus obovatus TaxID=246614 RepID=UPI003D9E2DDB
MGASCTCIHRLIQTCCLILILLINFGLSFPDPGKWSFTTRNQSCHYFETHKALYEKSQVSVKAVCDPLVDSKDMKIKIGFVVRETPCFEEYIGPQLMVSQFLGQYYHCPVSLLGDFGYNKVNYYKSEEIEVTCDHLIDQKLKYIKGSFQSGIIGSSNGSFCKAQTPICDTSPSSSLFLSEPGSVDPDNFDSIIMRKKRAALNKISDKSFVKSDDSQVTIPSDGIYLLVVYMYTVDSNTRFSATVDIEMKGQHGYLSADEEPLLPFYGFMSMVYFLYAVGWLVASAMQWRDLLRIQFWIGGVIFLGMLENAVFYAEFQSINSSGVSVKGALLAAELISCLKRTLARMLVIIVSLGFGIVKPRLGPMLHRVVCVGGLFFSLSALEAVLRVYKSKIDPNNQTLMAGIPLAVMDSVICWWIFSSLVQTMRTLRLRRNLVKLHSYRMFTNTLITAVFVSVIFMIWVIHYHKLTRCITDWRQIWLDNAFWDVLFSAVLLVIMVLWRPTNNNQRYAFTPLLDASDDEDDLSDHIFSADAFEGIRVRQQSSINSTANNSSKTKDTVLSKEAEEDLRWIEENIPSSLVDAALPALIDSDEEIMSTRFERNKME